MAIQMKRSRGLFEEAKRYLPGGVSSPVRAFTAVGGEPIFISAGRGSRIYDADGNEFIDYVLSWGPLILGHVPPQVVAGLKNTLEKGTSFGAPTELESELAKLIVKAMPAMEMIRLVNSGTEAVMSAIRLCRAFTHRDRIVKFSGCYHGHADGLLIRGGSGLATLGIPDSSGIPSSYTQNTLVAPYNALTAVRQIFETYPEEIAGVIVEPVCANMGVVLPKEGFLHGLHQLTREFGALLIFDEVVTGFRLSYGGAQAIYGITPDLCCLGKIIGGGLPVGAYGGKREIMEMVAPLGPVYQAGTLSGNPLTMRAGIETLKLLGSPSVYRNLENKAAHLAQGIATAAKEQDIPVFINRLGSMFTTFFTSQQVVDYETACSSDTNLYAAYFWQMLEGGIYLPPSQFEATFLSLAHSDAEIEATIETARYALSRI